MQIIDISPLVSKSTAVFPGDQVFSRQQLLSFKNKNHLELSSILTTLHIGAHADAPSHYHAEGESIEHVDLKKYLGPCTLIKLDKLSPRQLITPDMIAGLALRPRVLFCTHSYEPNCWSDDFCAFHPELIYYLAEKNVTLVGIDTPSVDLSDSKDLLSHQALFQTHMAVLEGLCLSHIKQQGEYFLIALPLKLVDCEASPVRAVLLAMPSVEYNKLID